MNSINRICVNNKLIKEQKEKQKEKEKTIRNKDKQEKTIRILINCYNIKIKPKLMKC